MPDSVKQPLSIPESIPVTDPVHRPGVGETPADKPSPRQPDWLIVLIAGLLLLTLFIAWLTDLPLQLP